MFDFLITDLVMPKLNGTELAIKLRELRPGLPVLYASGYTRGALGDAAGEPNSGFLPKPFTRAGLEQAIQTLLAA
jgi:two-component SAPR family response regulator